MKHVKPETEMHRQLTQLREQAVLCGLLYEPTWIKLVYGRVEPEDFAKASHQVLAEVIWQRYEEKGSFDAAAVFGEIFNSDRCKHFKQEVLTGDYFGFWPYNWNGPIQETMAEHAAAVHRAAKRRTMASLSQDLYNLSENPFAESPELIQKAAVALEELRVKAVRPEEDGLVAPAARRLIGSMNESDGDVDRILTGFTDFDKLTGGFHRGEYVIVAGRPGVGKTTWALNVLLRCAKQGMITAVVSLDMRISQLVQSLAVMESQVNGHHVRNRSLTETERMYFVSGVEAISKLPIYAFQAPGTVLEIKAKVAGLTDLRLLIIDHIQKLTDLEHKKHGRTQEITAISRDISRLAHDLAIPVIAISQLKRLGTRQVPVLSDLRESGALEQDADMVGFLYRDPEDERIMRLKIEKQRHGPTGSEAFVFRGDCLRFETYQKQEELEHWQP